MDSKNTPTIEKALLADICLGLPIGKLVFNLPRVAPKDLGVEPPDTYIFWGEQLAALKHFHRAGNKRVVAGVDALRAAADEAIREKAPSVTDKPRSRFSENPHDYQSLAKYFWPNTETDTTIPYVRKDGEVNPECYSEDFDYLRLVNLSETLVLLSVAAYVLDQKAYADHAAHMVDTWFVNEDTRQTPHFQYAQVKPGHGNEGGWSGLIEARFLIYVTEAVRLLNHGGHLAPALQRKVRAWFASFLEWIQESEQGRKAGNAHNNIGFWVDLQRVVYADFCNDHCTAEAILSERIQPRIAEQIEADGTLPAELTRAHPHDYVAFTLVAMALISRAGKQRGADIWSQTEGDGRSFQAAHDWLLRTTRLRELSQGLPMATRSTEQVHWGLGELIDTGIKLRMVERLNQANYTSALEQQITDLRFDVQSALEELEGERTAFRNLLAKQDAWKAYCQTLQHRIHQLTTSASWRLTAPFRFAPRTLRRFLTGTPSTTDTIPNPPTAIRQHLRADNSPSRSRMRSRIAGLLPEPAKQAAKAMLRTLGLRGGTLHASQPQGRSRQFTPKEHLQNLRSFKPENENQLRRNYENSPLNEQPDIFVLYRVIGNDLYPRHKIGQSRENLAFVLENEPALPACEKRWIVNRIVDKDEERRIIALLEEHGQAYIRIPFDPVEYLHIGWDYDALPHPDFIESKEFARLGAEEQDRCRTALYRLKNNYVMNNNGARNTALRDGRNRAKWVLPWDGNCFVTLSAWDLILRDVLARPWLKYFAVPMERLLENNDLLKEQYTPNPVDEPQLIFRCDASEQFNEEVPYGRRPKIELFWRLCIPGPWDSWEDDPWDPPRRSMSPESCSFGTAGWVFRMYSGMKKLEVSGKRATRARMLARRQAIIDTLDHIDQVCLPPPSPRDIASPSTIPIDSTRNARKKV